MIPAIGLLLSIYLVFKGVEIDMIYLTGTREDNAGKHIAVLALTAAVVIGGFFARLSLTSGSNTQTPRMP